MRRAAPATKKVVVQLSFGLATVLSIKALYAAGSVDQLLFAGKERMATRTYLEPYLRFGGTGLPGLAACAMDGGIYVFWMYIGLHCALTPVANFSAKLTFKAN